MIHLLTVAGVIGAGKTSLARRLAKHLHSKAYLEPVKNNPVLPEFYHGNKLVAEGKWKHNPYTFLLQIYFLNIRFRMMKHAMQNDNNVLDRSIFEDKIFMKMNYDIGTTTTPEWNVYKSLLSNMMEELPYAAHKKAPDLMIYLKISYPTMLQHIKKRGRPYEQIKNNPNLAQYYQTLIKYYQRWHKSYSYSPIMTIDCDKYDFVNHYSDYNAVINRIDNKLKEVHHE